MSSTPAPHHIGTLEIGQDLSGQEFVWKLQRWGRTLLVLFLLAGCIGVFGGGWLGRSDASDPTGALKVSHPRLARMESPVDLRVAIGSSLVVGEEVALWIDAGFLDGLEVASIRPAPVEEVADAGRVVYRFRVGQAGIPVPVTFHATPRHFGFRHGRIGVIGGPEVAVGRLVFP